MARKENRPVSAEEANTRVAFTNHRKSLPCSACKGVGTFNFTADGNGRTRFQCNNKSPRCHHSLSVSGMLSLLKSRHLAIPNVSASNVTRQSPAQSPFSFNFLPTSQPAPQDETERDPSVLSDDEDFGEDLPRFDKRTATEVSFLDDPEREAPLHVLSRENDDLRKQIARMQAQQDASNKQMTALVQTVTTLTTEIQALRKDLAVPRPPAKTSAPAFTFNPPLPGAVPSNPPTPRTSAASTNLNQAQPTTPTLAAPERKTYAEIAAERGLTGNNHENGVRALTKLLRRPAPKADATKLDRIYVQGISRMPIKELKTILRELRIRTSTICSISFVGAATAEFLVQSVAAHGFKKAIVALSPVEGRIRVLTTYNASTTVDIKATEESKTKCRAAFIRRLHGIIAHSPNDATKDYYRNWLNELDLPLPTEEQPAPNANTNTDVTDMETDQPVPANNNTNSLNCPVSTDGTVSLPQ